MNLFSVQSNTVSSHMTAGRLNILLHTAKFCTNCVMTNLICIPEYRDSLTSWKCKVVTKIIHVHCTCICCKSTIVILDSKTSRIYSHINLTYQHKHPPFPLLQPHEEECNSSCLLNLGPLHVVITTSQPLHGRRNKHCEEGSSLLRKQRTKKHALSLTIGNSNITNIRI